MRPQGRASVSRSFPKAHAICDRCGFRYLHEQLSWQFEWLGPRLQKLTVLVCRRCLDVPQENIRTIVIPPDPVPIQNPRPEQYASEVPSFLATENSSALVNTVNQLSIGDQLITESGNNLITEINTTPTPTSSGYTDGGPI